MSSPAYLGWIVAKPPPLATPSGIEISVWTLSHADDDDVLCEWCLHLRTHYCDDSELDALRSGTGLSREEFSFNLYSQTNRKGPAQAFVQEISLKSSWLTT